MSRFGTLLSLDTIVVFIYIYIFYGRLSEPRSRCGLGDEEGSCLLLRKATPVVWAVDSNLPRRIILSHFLGKYARKYLLCAAEQSRFQIRSTPHNYTSIHSLSAFILGVLRERVIIF
jgi:hypothetical protein